ncbi:hypothetical protein KY325_00420 [Candidatus Woesearchaeota archaeon]|nr:hypothetical protein [Candidatus Woesearchaeota archaeon]MBW3017609.1 hypothetical protein [Candidatus Woesearchaeota archaeon]
MSWIMVIVFRIRDGRRNQNLGKYEGTLVRTDKGGEHVFFSIPIAEADKHKFKWNSYVTVTKWGPGRTERNLKDKIALSLKPAEYK